VTRRKLLGEQQDLDEPATRALELSIRRLAHDVGAPIELRMIGIA
jgi:hypothetical protein